MSHIDVSAKMRIGRSNLQGVLRQHTSMAHLRGMEKSCIVPQWPRYMMHLVVKVVQVVRVVKVVKVVMVAEVLVVQVTVVTVALVVVEMAV